VVPLLHPGTFIAQNVLGSQWRLDGLHYAPRRAPQGEWRGGWMEGAKTAKEATAAVERQTIMFHVAS